MQRTLYSLFTLLILTGSFSARGQFNCFGLFKSIGPTTAVEKKTAIPEPEFSLWEKDAIELKRIHGLQGEEKKAALRAYAKPSTKTAMDKSWVFANWGLAGLATLFAAKGFHADPYHLLLATEMMLPTLYAVDVASQVGHYYLDAVASTKGFMKYAVRGFRQHHENFNNLNEEDYLSTTSDFGLTMAPLFAGLAVASPFLPPEVTTSFTTFLLGFMNTMEVHKQAHLGRNASPFFKALQKANLTVSHKVHLAHHAPPFNDNYAVFSGWFNPMAKRLRLWERADLALWRKYKVLPHTWIEDPGGIPEEVIKELKLHPELVQNELWANADAYPKRVPESLKKLLETTKEKWKAEFVYKRRILFQEAMLSDTTGKSEAEFEKEWFEEQKKLSWIYGDVKHSLFE